jgi:hypothetical protein
MPTSTKCQKIEKKMTINVIHHDDRLYLGLFYNAAFSIASKNDLDDQNLLLATVQWPAIKTSHHFSLSSKSKCVINPLMTLTFK